MLGFILNPLPLYYEYTCIDVHVGKCINVCMYVLLNNKEFISHRYCQGILDVRILFLYFYCD